MIIMRILIQSHSVEYWVYRVEKLTKYFYYCKMRFDKHDSSSFSSHCLSINIPFAKHAK